MCIFASSNDFYIYHKDLGENCNYFEMKREMLKGFQEKEIKEIPEIFDLDIELTWLDLSFIKSSIGNLIENISEIDFDFD
jgi:hypothetical protein